MNAFTIATLMLIIIQTQGLILNATEMFSSEKKSKAARFLTEKKFPEFELVLQDLIGSSKAKDLRLTSSYKMAMHEILASLGQDYVLLEKTLSDHVLIPQCDCQYPRAFLLEYHVLRSMKYTPYVRYMVTDKMKSEAEAALERINKNKYALWVAAFHHVKEVVKIGLSFFNRTSTTLVFETEKVNEVLD